MITLAIIIVLILVVAFAFALDFPADSTPPEVGGKYVLRPRNGDPFPGKYDHNPSTVLEVKDGWVRYKIGSGLLFDDERKSIEDFNDLYRKL